MQPYEVISVTARCLDCCLPCYFQGSDADEVLCIPVNGTTTYREACEDLEQEFHATSGFFDDVAGSGTMVEHALHKLFDVVSDMDAVMDLDEDEKPCDDGEPCFLYIGLWGDR